MFVSHTQSMAEFVTNDALHVCDWSVLTHGSQMHGWSGWICHQSLASDKRLIVIWRYVKGYSDMFFGIVAKYKIDLSGAIRDQPFGCVLLDGILLKGRSIQECNPNSDFSRRAWKAILGLPGIVAERQLELPERDRRQRGRIAFINDNRADRNSVGPVRQKGSQLVARSPNRCCGSEVSAIDGR